MRDLRQRTCITHRDGVFEVVGKQNTPAVKPNALAAKPKTPVAKPKTPAAKSKTPAPKPKPLVPKPNVLAAKQNAPATKPKTLIEKSKTPMHLPEFKIDLSNLGIDDIKRRKQQIIEESLPKSVLIGKIRRLENEVKKLQAEIETLKKTDESGKTYFFQTLFF